MPDNKSNQANISLPEQKNYDVAYELAFKLAGEKLAGQQNPEEQCRRSGSECQSAGPLRTITLKYLGRSYRISLPEITIAPEEGSTEVEMKDRILILHYLTRAKGTPLSQRMITYQELQEGAAYFPSFYKRAVKPLVDHFGPCPELLVETAMKIGGYRAGFGDAAATIPAFSRVPITLVIWKGDEEFPPDGSILFDSTILDYLSVEDVNVLCQSIVWQMVRLKGRN